jgi:hypothetical protein
MRALPNRLSRGLALAFVAGGLTVALTTPASAGSLTALNDPVTVSLTVTGPSSVVLYDDDVSTTGHVVTPLTEDAHLCDGTNANANSSAGATPTAALDDSGLDWDGTWYASYDDYLVSEIDGEATFGSMYWEISVNGQPISAGGCQVLIGEGDDVAFTWTQF